VKFHSLRNSLVSGAFALLAAVLLASCGGGGAATTSQGGAVSISPTVGTIYAGNPFTFQITGGRGPYTITSSEPALLPVPTTVTGTSFTVVANNPGVIDIGLEPGALPIRTVVITVREGNGTSAQSSMAVGQNFLTSYGISFAPSSCPVAAGAEPSANPCAGGDTVITLSATFNGNLAGDRQFRLEALRGPFTFLVPGTGASGSIVTVTSDHSGTVTAILRVPAGVPTQIAVLRVVDVQTGVYTDHAFVISGSTSTLTAIPNTITFTGALTTQCGTGSADFLVFDGIAPYTATSSNPNITVTPSQSNSNPGRFTVTATNPNVCSTSTIVVQDSIASRTLVTVTTAAGTATPPATAVPLVVAPNQVTVGCGQSASVSIIGGGTTTTPATAYSASSANPNITVAISGRTLTITRTGAPPRIGATNTTSAVTVTDGSQATNVTVTSPDTCS
jgi:hypothetical protein